MVGLKSGENGYTCTGTITGTQTRVFPFLERSCGLKEVIGSVDAKASPMLVEQLGADDLLVDPTASPVGDQVAA